MGDQAVWSPRVTVAAICEKEGQFLVVREKIEDRQLINQPAGHLEPDESLEQAIIREVLEETAYDFRPSSLLGIYRYQPDLNKDTTFLRFTFCGEITNHDPARDLDQDIDSIEWMSLETLQACRHSHRSPMVLQCVLDYLQQPAYSLQVFSRQFT